MRRSQATVTLAVAVLVMAFGAAALAVWGGALRGDDGPSAESAPAVVAGAPATVPPLPTATGGTVRIGAAGDIACAPDDDDFRGGMGSGDRCRQRATSDLLLAERLAAVLPLGDLQYESGSARAFRQSYAPTWGRLRAITRPVPGNHEYRDDGAAAYFRYFGSGAGSPSAGWYSYDLGAWHVVALNSNCEEIGGCGARSAQGRWLAADLARHRAKCTLAYSHHPWRSSGKHGGERSIAPLVRLLHQSGVDVLLSGHDHDYERFAPLAADGSVDPAGGLRQFVVGTGGKELRDTGRSQATEAVNDDTLGVLLLTLAADSYTWEFRPVPGSGSFTDRGSTRCH